MCWPVAQAFTSRGLALGVDSRANESRRMLTLPGAAAADGSKGSGSSAPRSGTEVRSRWWCSASMLSARNINFQEVIYVCHVCVSLSLVFASSYGKGITFCALVWKDRGEAGERDRK